MRYLHERCLPIALFHILRLVGYVSRAAHQTTSISRGGVVWRVGVEAYARKRTKTCTDSNPDTATSPAPSKCAAFLGTSAEVNIDISPPSALYNPPPPPRLSGLGLFVTCFLRRCRCGLMRRDFRVICLLGTEVLWGIKYFRSV